MVRRLTVGYDAKGNTLTKADSAGTTTYNWDFENRLTSLALPGGTGTVTFKYDPFGRRIEKSSASGTTNYLYDGNNSVEEADQTGAELTHYSQADSIDEPLAAARSGAIGFYEQDGMGSVTSLTGSTGTVLNSYTYDAYGNVASSTGSFVNPFLYTGRDYDSETGLRYYRARYYDPQTGRFLSEDPLGFGGGDVNFYSYVGNSPTNLDDPFGMTKKIPDDCEELRRYIEDLYRIFDGKRKQYDPVENGSGSIPRRPKFGGGFHEPGIHYFNLIDLQIKLIAALLKWDNTCGGGGNQAPVCDRQKVKETIPPPVIRIPVIDPIADWLRERLQELITWQPPKPNPSQTVPGPIWQWLTAE